MEIIEVIQVHHPLEALMLDLVEAFTAKGTSHAYVGGRYPGYSLSKPSAKVAVVLSKLTSNCRFITSIFTGSDKVCKVNSG